MNDRNGFVTFWDLLGVAEREQEMANPGDKLTIQDQLGIAEQLEDVAVKRDKKSRVNNSVESNLLQCATNWGLN